MGDNSKHRKFLAYINNLMSREGIMVIYDANNIRFDKCELYSDFVQSLLMIVFNTYMGDEYTNPQEQYKHFEWCWKQNTENFKEEGITFTNHRLQEYFFEYVYEVFYSSDKKLTESIDNFSLKLWYDIFDYDKLKTESDMDTFIEIYKLFEKSIKKTE